MQIVHPQIHPRRSTIFYARTTHSSGMVEAIDIPEELLAFPEQFAIGGTEEEFARMELCQCRRQDCPDGMVVEALSRREHTKVDEVGAITSNIQGTSIVVAITGQSTFVVLAQSLSDVSIREER